MSLTVFGLLIIGLIMISSASVVSSYERFGNNNYFLIRQILNAFIGTVLLVFFYFVDYKFWKKVSFTLLAFTIVLLFLVFLIGVEYGGAKRWLTLGSFFLQPTEVAKLVYILYLAAWLENRGEKIKNLQTGLVPFVLMTGLIGVLTILQPDFGTAMVITLTAFFMYVIAGAGLKQILILGSGGLVAVWFLIKSSAYRFTRLSVFLNPSADAKGIGYHINQALLAIGSGGIFGLGFGLSRQKYNYLPEPMGDSIFAIIAEEIGFLRAVVIILLFLLVAYRGYMIARGAGDTFGRLVAFGITSWLTIQVAINIAAMLSLIPLTGIPLPFISYGGSSLITSMAGIGILLNISKSSSKGDLYESPNRRWWNRRPYNSSLGRRRRIAPRR